MYKRLPYLALAVLSLAIAASLRAGPLGAVIVSLDIDSTKNTVTLHMLNNSAKDITFYNVSIRETYSENVNEHQFSQEMLGIAMLIEDPTYVHHEDLREMYHGGNGTWQAGQPRDQVLIVQPGLTGFEATIDTVTYADNMAETTNLDALKRELDNRKTAAQTIEATNAAIRRALTNSADQSPHETAAKEIEDLQNKWEASGHVGSFNPGASGRVISALKETPAVATYLHQTIPEYLNNMISRNSKMASLLLEHASPKLRGAK